MANEPPIDLEKAHKFFAADCFNRTWDYLDKKDRTRDDDLAMLHASLASLWHWTQRSDKTPQTLSVGYWQVSRVYAVLKQADNAKRYGELSLAESSKPGVEPFYLGYSNEALARAESVAGNADSSIKHKQLAEEAAAKVSDEESKKMLLADLSGIA